MSKEIEQQEEETLEPQEEEVEETEEEVEDDSPEEELEEESDDESEDDDSENDDDVDYWKQLAIEREKELKKAQNAILKNKDRVKEVKKKTQKKPSKQQDNSLSREEAILFAQGKSVDEVEKIAKIADIEGIDLIEASQSELFKAYQKSQEDRNRREKSSLGASKGSGIRKKQKDVKTPGLSKEDHRKLWSKGNK